MLDALNIVRSECRSMSDSSIREGPSVGMQVRIESSAQPLLPSKLQDWASKLGLPLKGPINGLRKNEAGPMDGMLPEVDAGLLLQVEVWGSSNQLPQVGNDEPGLKQGSSSRSGKAPTVAAWVTTNDESTNPKMQLASIPPQEKFSDRFILT